ncbi:MAG: hypothetical protein KQI78_25270 [Deltaproteobacteria bacterium]|nr:hypothetical protein [Deltaproteobacteria bacterium]
MHIILISIVAAALVVMFYYRIRMDFVLSRNDQLRWFPPRFAGENIKLFIAIIEQEEDPKKQANYLSIYKGIKYSRWGGFLAVAIMFLAIILT